MPKEKSIFIISSEKCTTSSFCFRTSMALRSSRAVLIAPVYASRSTPTTMSKTLVGLVEEGSSMEARCFL
ncbi:unnamed protein product [Malus baccata var. baccata]